jgi:TP901-1 family phage major tail protein
MVKIAGVDVLVYVSSEGGEPQMIGGQSSCSLELSSETISTTDKNSEGWSTSIPGIKSFSVSAEGFVVEDDASLDLLEQKFMDREELDIEIRFPNGKTYTAPVYLTSFPLEMSQDSAVTYSLEFVGAGPLVITPSTPPPA